jgi:hypothetical protein
MFSIMSAYPGPDLTFALRVGMEFQTRGVPMNDPRFTE